MGKIPLNLEKNNKKKITDLTKINREKTSQLRAEQEWKTGKKNE